MPAAAAGEPRARPRAFPASRALFVAATAPAYPRHGTVSCARTAFACDHRRAARQSGHRGTPKTDDRTVLVGPVETSAVEDLVRAMGGSGVPDSGVSWRCKRIDARMQALLARPFAGPWPYLRRNATCRNGREGGRIVRLAVIVAASVNPDGRREALGIAIRPSQAETYWTHLLRTFADRGLPGASLVVADDHEGLRPAPRRVFKTTWQRRRVRWTLTVLAATGARSGAPAAAMPKTIFAQASKAAATEQGRRVAHALRATRTWGHRRLGPRALGATRAWGHAHLGPRALQATRAWGHALLGPPALGA
ncbi:MAG: transposase [Pseudomonadota bacterium]